MNDRKIRLYARTGLEYAWLSLVLSRSSGPRNRAAIRAIGCKYRAGEQVNDIRVDLSSSRRGCIVPVELASSNKASGSEHCRLDALFGRRSHRVQNARVCIVAGRLDRATIDSAQPPMTLIWSTYTRSKGSSGRGTETEEGDRERD